MTQCLGGTRYRESIWYLQAFRVVIQEPPIKYPLVIVIAKGTSKVQLLLSLKSQKASKYRVYQRIILLKYLPTSRLAKKIRGCLHCYRVLSICNYRVLGTEKNETRMRMQLRGVWMGGNSVPIRTTLGASLLDRRGKMRSNSRYQGQRIYNGSLAGFSSEIGTLIAITRVTILRLLRRPPIPSLKVFHSHCVLPKLGRMQPRWRDETGRRMIGDEKH